MRLLMLIFMFFLVAGVSVKANNKENKEFLAEVVKEFKKECKGEKGVDYLNCWADYSPEKCKGLVYGKDKSAWSRCVYSCGSASIYSKTFGECSK